MTLSLAALGAIVFLSYTTQAMTGFGSTVIALTLGAHLFPIPELIPVLVALNVPLCAFLVTKHRQEIDLGLLGKEILPWMGLGLIGGLAAAGALSGPLLRRAFGALIAVSAARELIALAVGEERRMLGAGAFRLCAAAAGVVHGVYASGGPMLTFALSRRPLDRGAFRATLLAVWLVFNAAMLLSCIWRGTWDAESTRRTLWLLPVIPLGMFLGERLHARVPERGFRATVQAVLLISGASLIGG